MSEEEILLEVIVNESDTVQFYSNADQCKVFFEESDSLLRTIIEAVRENVLTLPTLKWEEIETVRLIPDLEKSLQLLTKGEIVQESEYNQNFPPTYELVEEANLDETTLGSENIPEEIIYDVGLDADERLNLCPSCDYRTYNVGHFKVHMRQHTGEAPFACEFCPYRSKQKSNLKRHLRQHLEGKDNFECEMCSFKCTKEKVYKRHLKLHQRSRPLRTCPFCDYFSSSLAHLTVHIRQHTGETPYHCGVCHYKTVQKSNLTRHLKKHRHHRISKADKLRVCSYCSYRTPNSAHLLAHVRAAHTGEAPYSCKYCDYKSAQRSNLKRHMRKHTGERPFSCHLCSYSTAYPYVLKKHIENHTGIEEKLNCELCDFFTNSSIEYRRHLKQHSGRTMYCCQYCGYVTLNSDHFKVHLRRHTKENPYQCHYCDYTSTQRSNLKRHITKHTAHNQVDNDVNETQNLIQPEISVLDENSSEVIEQRAQILNGENVQIIDTTELGNQGIEIYESDSAFVEANYSPGGVEEEVVSEEHIVTTSHEVVLDSADYNDNEQTYMCSLCSYQSISCDEVEEHLQVHEGVQVNEIETSESAFTEKGSNLSFLNKKQTEKLKEFKRLLQQGTSNTVNNVNQLMKIPDQNVIMNTVNINQPHVPVQYTNEPSPEEVTLYGEYVEECLISDGSYGQSGLQFRDDSSVIIVENSNNAKSDKGGNLCKLCGFRARTIWELKSHIRVHTGEMSYVCAQCPFKTNQFKSYERHVQHLHGRRGNRSPYRCNDCSFKTRNRVHLNKHKQTHIKTTVECTVCEKILQSEVDLKAHMKQHSGSSPFQCHYCGKRAERKSLMRKHMKRHICNLEGKGPPFECDSCGYQTVFKSNYFRHLRTHDLDPPKTSICHYCRFVTLDTELFKKHLEVHKNPDKLESLKKKMNLCPYCDYNTYNNGHFKVHLRQHIGITPYVCSLCQYSSAQRSNLKRHLRLKHNRGLDDNMEVDNEDTPGLSKRQPLREHNIGIESEASGIPSNKIKHPLAKDSGFTSSIRKTKRSLNGSGLRKREYVKRVGKATESELKIKRRLTFSPNKIPKDADSGYSMDVSGEILKSKRALKGFKNYGNLVKNNDFDLSVVLSRKSQLDPLFKSLKEGLQNLKDQNRSNENLVFTVYFKNKDEPDNSEIGDNLTDIEEMLTDSSESDDDSVDFDDELSSQILLDNSKRVSSHEKSIKEFDLIKNGNSTMPFKKKLAVNSEMELMKFFQDKIRERNEKTKEMRRLKVLRNSSNNVNKNNENIKVECSFNESTVMEGIIESSDALPCI